MVDVIFCEVRFEHFHLFRFGKGRDEGRKIEHWVRVGPCLAVNDRQSRSPDHALFRKLLGNFEIELVESNQNAWGRRRLPMPGAANL